MWRKGSSVMKRSKLNYEEWKCILSKDLYCKNVESDDFSGYIGLLDIHEVREPQIWRFNGEDLVVCDNGLKWLTILPKDDFYCITAMMNPQKNVLVWYIDMIAGQGQDADQVAYIDDLYLDLVVYPDGTVMEDDMDELEEALRSGDISKELFDLALETCNKLKTGLLSDIEEFKEFTRKCYELQGL